MTGDRVGERTTTMRDRLAGPATVASRVLGTRRDWRLVRPGPRLPAAPARAWTGPAVVAVTTFATWPAFAGTVGEEGNAGFALYIGSVSIALMAWSLVLALRPSSLEGAFGGLDRMYRVHRWCGGLAVGAMWLHTSTVDDVKGVPGASRQLADQAEELAELGETLLYVSIAVSVVRLVPYRWWRWMHKAIGVPYVFASWHFFTATKPFGNGSPWGVYFVVVMVAGTLAWLWRVGVADVFGRGRAYRVVSVTRSGGCTDIALEPAGRPVQHRAGQFAFVRFGRSGGGEPHPLSIASPPGSARLRFVVRELGDWSDRLHERVAVGDRARIEGPYGRFAPVPDQAMPTVWIAGGVGITPFLSAIGPARANGVVPHVFFSVGSADDAPALSELRRADAAGHIRLRVRASDAGNRLRPDDLEAECGDLSGTHVALCGPTGLVRTMARAARDLGSTSVEHEEFDIRSGLGPDLSRDLDEAVATIRARRSAVPAQPVGVGPRAELLEDVTGTDDADVVVPVPDDLHSDG